MILKEGNIYFYLKAMYNWWSRKKAPVKIETSIKTPQQQLEECQAELKIYKDRLASLESRFERLTEIVDQQSQKSTVEEEDLIEDVWSIVTRLLNEHKQSIDKEFQSYEHRLRNFYICLESLQIVVKNIQDNDQTNVFDERITNVINALTYAINEFSQHRNKVDEDINGLREQIQRLWYYPIQNPEEIDLEKQDYIIDIADEKTEESCQYKPMMEFSL